MTVSTAWNLEIAGPDWGEGGTWTRQNPYFCTAVKEGQPTPLLGGHPMQDGETAVCFADGYIYQFDVLPDPQVLNGLTRLDPATFPILVTSGTFAGLRNSDGSLVSSPSTATTKARFIQGKVATLDYTPSLPGTAGLVAAFGDGIAIVHVNVEANRLGALAIGGGTYDFVKDDVEEFAWGDDVYWDENDSLAVASATDHLYVGKCVKAAGASDVVVRAHHLQPTGA